MKYFDRMLLMIGFGLVFIGAGAILLKYESEVVALVTGVPVAEAQPEAAPLSVGEAVEEVVTENAEAISDNAATAVEWTEPIEANEAVGVPEEIAEPAAPEPAADEAPRFPFFPSVAPEVTPETELEAESWREPMVEDALSVESELPAAPSAPERPTVLEMKPALKQPAPGHAASGPGG